jgi:hypothetical protein
MNKLSLDAKTRGTKKLREAPTRWSLKSSDLELDPSGLVLTKPLELDAVQATVERLARG